MIWTETPFTLNSGVLQQSGFERLPMPNSPTTTSTSESSLEKSRSMHQISETPFALNNNEDLFEPFPLTVASHQDDSRRRFPPYHSFISLSSSKLDSLPEIENDAILFDRLAEVCNLTDSSTSSAKRVSPMQGMSTSEESPRKKQRQVDSDSEDETSPRFRPYQQKHWDEQFECLLAFREARGHCCVPHDYEKDKMVSRWVRRQRYQYKLKQEGKKSTMTDARILKLDAIGFVWDSHSATWSERLSELKDFLHKTGNCNVPATYPPNPPLSTWVKCQRRQYKLFHKGLPSNITLDRIKALDMLGFEWDRSNGKRNRQALTTPLATASSALTEAL